MDDYSQIHCAMRDLSVLYVEDDKSFQKETCEILHYFFHKVDLADDGEEALKCYLEHHRKHSKYHDLVITDINMPKLNGIGLARSIYSHNEMQHIIVISAHNESHYLIDLINTGVEHFMLKPMAYEDVIEVLGKVARKIAKKSIKKQNDHQILLGENSYWDSQKSILYQAGQYVKLTRKEILLMQVLVKSGTKITTNEMIFDQLWSDDLDNASLSALQPIISRLRKKLPKNSIENVYGFGYRLNL